MEHLAAWERELAGGVSPGISFGENLSVIGAIETDVCIGDEFRHGDVVLRVTSPRRPCYKLGMHLGDTVPGRMNDTGRCGWYFEVVSPGELPTSGVILTLESRPEGAPTVAKVFADKVKADPVIPDMPNEA